MLQSQQQFQVGALQFKVNESFPDFFGFFWLKDTLGVLGFVFVVDVFEHKIVPKS